MDNDTKKLIHANAWNANLSNADFDKFIYVCEAKELDPMMNEIYASAYKDKRASEESRRNRGGDVYRMSIITQIDGYRAIARRDRLAGIDDAVFEESKDDGLRKASVTVYRWSESGEKESYTASAHWSEYCPPEFAAAMWLKMPHVMLGKCAEALALRKAFSGLSGLYIKEEMDQAGHDAPRNEKPEPESKPPPQERQQAPARAKPSEEPKAADGTRDTSKDAPFELRNRLAQMFSRLSKAAAERQEQAPERDAWLIEAFKHSKLDVPTPLPSVLTTAQAEAGVRYANVQLANIAKQNGEPEQQEREPGDEPDERYGDGGPPDDWQPGQQPTPERGA